MEVASAAIPIGEPTDVAEARRRGSERARRLGFDEVEIGAVSLVITETATNLLKHAGGGELLIGPAMGEGRHGVQVLALDRGRGMNVPASMHDGYSTTGTAGTGLGAIARAASTFDVYTQPGRGTVLGATVYPRGVVPLPVGGLAVPMRADDACGDGWTVWSAGELTSILLSDGLGHGTDAAAATAAALATFQRHAERSASDVVAGIHEALRSTRGAALAVAELDHRHDTLRYCGIGNISATIIPPGRAPQHLVSLSGIAGHNVRRIQPFTYEWVRGSLLVMTSDGIGTRWSLSADDGPGARRADVVAGVLFRDHRRGRDDASVVVARHGERP